MDQLACLASGNEDGREGYNNQDLISFIPYDKMIPDDLHLRIRITSKMVNQLVTWAILLKLKDKVTAEMKRIGVAFQFFEEQGDDQNGKISKWTQPSGEKMFYSYCMTY
ncbi:uncharacterized protein [Littorina saxatilis]|uniref:uncharacterized protein n=1 Tax=Littorina saxatilis TaxID=31220 RepID=UPI0038B6519C